MHEKVLLIKISTKFENMSLVIRLVGMIEKDINSIFPTFFWFFMLSAEILDFDSSFPISLLRMHHQ